MKSRTTARFRSAFGALPRQVQDQARRAYSLFQQNPKHPSLRFKRIHATKLIYSARVGFHYRALGIREGDEILWFWIGSHADYDGLTSRG